MIKMSDFQSDLSRNNIPKNDIIYQHIILYISICPYLSICLSISIYLYIHTRTENQKNLKGEKYKRQRNKEI